MELKVLDFKEFNHIKYEEIESKYENDPNPVTFTLDEFKSIVSLLFSVQYHTPEVSEEHLHNIADILYEEYPIVNITSKFGRQMIENLENDYLEWMISLSNKSYRIYEMIFNEELNDFVHLALIDYMIIRKFEYGKFFLNEWSKLFFNLDGYSLSMNVAEIIGIFRTKEDALKMLCDKLLKKNSDLSGYEVLLLAFTFKELFYKSDRDFINYALTNFIVRDKIHELNARIDILKLSMIKEINPNQKTNDNTHNKKNNNDKDIDEEGLNKGKGGPKTMKNLDEVIDIIKENLHRNYLIIRKKKYYDFEELLSFQRDLQGSSKTLQGYKIKFIDYLSMRRALIILLQEKYYTYKSYDEVQIELSQLENNAKSRFIIRNRDMRNFKTPQDIHPKDPCSHYEDDINKKKHYRIALEILTRLNLLDETDLKAHKHFKSIYEDISNC